MIAPDHFMHHEENLTWFLPLLNRRQLLIVTIHKSETEWQHSSANNQHKQLRFHEKALKQIHVYAETNQKKISATARLRNVAPLDSSSSAVDQCFTKFLQRCVIYLVLPLPHMNVGLGRAFVSLPQYLNSNPHAARTHHSFFAPIQSATQKCRRRMPQIVATGQMFKGATWTNRDLGRITCHRYEPHVRSCEIFR